MGTPGEPQLPGGWLPPQPPAPGTPAPPGPAPGAPRFEPSARGEQGPQQGPVFVRPSGSEGPRNTLAIWSLVVAIVALVLLMLSLGTLVPLTLPASLAALLVARAARRRVEAGLAGGLGQAQAGRALAWTGIVLGVIALIAWIALFSSGFSFDELETWLEDLRRDLEEQNNGGGSDGVEIRYGR